VTYFFQFVIYILNRFYVITMINATTMIYRPGSFVAIAQ